MSFGSQGLSPSLCRNIPKYTATVCVFVRRHDRSLVEGPEVKPSIVYFVRRHFKRGRRFSLFGGVCVRLQ